MEYICESILELILEGSMEASKNKKLPKWLRYLFIILIMLFFIFVIGLIFLTGIIVLKENKILGIFFILIGIWMLISSIIQFRKTYLIKGKEESKK